MGCGPSGKAFEDRSGGDKGHLSRLGSAHGTSPLRGLLGRTSAPSWSPVLPRGALESTPRSREAGATLTGAARPELVSVSPWPPAPAPRSSRVGEGSERRPLF